MNSETKQNLIKFALRSIPGLILTGVACLFLRTYGNLIKDLNLFIATITIFTGSTIGGNFTSFLLNDLDLPCAACKKVAGIIIGSVVGGFFGVICGHAVLLGNASNMAPSIGTFITSCVSGVIGGGVGGMIGIALGFSSKIPSNWSGLNY